MSLDFAATTMFSLTVVGSAQNGLDFWLARRLLFP
jgi:hypothetical protein